MTCTCPLDSPFRWCENRQPTVFATDPAFRPRQAPAPANNHNGAYGKAVLTDPKEAKS